MTRTAGIVGAAPRSGARRLVFGGVLVLSATVTLAFLAIPLLALLAEAPLGDVPSLLGDPVMRDIVVVTMRTNAIANLLILGFGTPTAYLFATRRFPDAPRIELVRNYRSTPRILDAANHVIANNAARKPKKLTG